MQVAIGFVSMSGNTEDIVSIIQRELEQHDVNVTITELDQFVGEDLSRFDGLLLGSYTWGDGDLPYEAEDFVEELREQFLDGMPVAAFGSGDLDYPKYCAAVDLIEDALKEAGATIIMDGLKIEFDPNTPEKQAACRAFAQTFHRLLHQVHS
jgi:flavodoxin I